jgi:hypothetical protein
MTCRAAVFVKLAVAGLALMLAACDASSKDRPPLINSGSYDWRDQFYGPNGYPLPGYGGYLAQPK